MNRLPSYLYTFAFFIGFSRIQEIFTQSSYINEVGGWGFVVAQAAPGLALAALLAVAGWQVSKRNKANETKDSNLQEPSVPVAPKEANPAVSQNRIYLGGFLMVVGAGLAFMPLLMAWASNSFSSYGMFNESSGGSSIWLMFFSVPIGGALAIYGLFKFIQGVTKSSYSIADSRSYTSPKGKLIMGIVILAFAGMMLLNMCFQLIQASMNGDFTSAISSMGSNFFVLIVTVGFGVWQIVRRNK